MPEVTNPKSIVCQFCGDNFAQGNIGNHERRCEKRTTEQRKKAADARIAYKKFYSKAARAAQGKRSGERAQEYVERVRQLTPARKSHHKRKGSLNQLQKEVRKASIMLNGKRVQVTLSLSWELVREIITELAPHVSIDRVELVS